MPDSPAPRMGDIELLSKADLRLRVKELLESEGRLIEVCRHLRVVEEHAGHLRDVVESIGVGGAAMTPREATLRAQCRLLVKAFDEGVRDAQ